MNRRHRYIASIIITIGIPFFPPSFAPSYQKPSQPRPLLIILSPSVGLLAVQVCHAIITRTYSCGETAGPGLSSTHVHGQETTRPSLVSAPRSLTPNETRS
ncbi:hypothetical protein GGI42DRAFT_322501 [Trichoderma sp. SZMC 28013]